MLKKTVPCAWRPLSLYFHDREKVFEIIIFTTQKFLFNIFYVLPGIGVTGPLGTTIKIFLFFPLYMCSLILNLHFPYFILDFVGGDIFIEANC